LFGKKHGKLAHGKNLSTKSFLGPDSLSISFDLTTCTCLRDPIHREIYHLSFGSRMTHSYSKYSVNEELKGFCKDLLFHK